MADIFEEVEEGIRQDKWAERWRKYGILAYVLAALLIGGTALYEYMQYRTANTLSQNSSAYGAALEAFESGNFEQAADSFETLAESGARVRVPAGHMLAEIRLSANGDPVTAAGVLTEMAGKAETPSQKLALLKAAYLQAESLDRAELQELLAPLLTEDATAFRALSRELLAAKAISEGDIEYARDELSLLRLMPNKPQGLDLRVAKALATLPPGSAAVEDPEAVIADPSGEEIE